jgi:hypothetical protein
MNRHVACPNLLLLGFEVTGGGTDTSVYEAEPIFWTSYNNKVGPIYK